MVRSRPPNFWVAPQGRPRRRAIRPLQAVGKHGGVLQRLRGALSKKRQHGMGRVAEYSDAPLRPPVQRSSVVECPPFGVGRGDDQLPQSVVPTFKLSKQIRNLAASGPRLGPPSPAGAIATTLINRPAEMG